MRRAGVLAALLWATAAAAAPPVFREEAHRLILADGRFLPLRLRVPEGVTGPLPALMLFGGFKQAAATLDRVHPDRPLLLASFDYPFEPPRRFSFPGSLRDAPALKRAIGDTLEGIALLHRHLQARADVDPARITVCGASAGAPFATVAGARGAVPGVILVQGFGALQSVVAAQLDARWQRGGERAWLRPLASALAWTVLHYLDPPDLEAHARGFRPGQRVLLVEARDDERIPAAATAALRMAAQASAARVEILALPGGHLNGEADAQIATILEHGLAWMTRQGLL